jgi:SPP1 family predicted phage head-tail adaptor
MKSGPMRHLVTLQVPQYSRDAAGQKRITFAAGPQFWGLLEPLSGRELVNAREVKAEVTTRFTTRWQGPGTIDPTMQIQYGSEIYKIAMILNLKERNRELNLLLIKIDAPGQ